MVNSEINSGSPTELQPLKILAEYFSQPSKRSQISTFLKFCLREFIIISQLHLKIYRESIVLKLDEQISGNLDVNNYVFLLVAGTIYYAEGSFETALKVLHQSDNLEW